MRGLGGGAVTGQLIDPMRIATVDSPRAAIFRSHLAELDAPRILELGTRRSDPNFPTEHRDWAPHAQVHVLSDIAPGLDVDVVADAHDLPATFEQGSFDALIAVAVLEHLARPWLALCSMAAMLRRGGAMYVSTHQTFPLHGYPNDYFRFSVEALAVLAEDARLEVAHIGYLLPARIAVGLEVQRWNTAAPAWLCVDAVLAKR